MSQSPTYNAPNRAAAVNTPRAGAAPGAGGSDYLRTKVMTATPEQLQLMLYDGAIRFAEQGKAALHEKKYDRSHDRLTRAQAIIVELLNGLRHDVSPDLCGKLAALYNYAYMRIVEANMSHDVVILDEALSVLRYQRETWTLLMQQTGQAKQENGASALPHASAPAERVERLSIAA